MAKRYGMVLDLSKCLGCYTCNVACKAYYGTRPEINYNQVEAVDWGEYPNAKQSFKLTMCNHCDDAPCIPVCPVEANYTTEEGVVLTDYEKCIGCGACVAACPYDQRQMVEDDVTSFEGVVMPFEEESSKRLDIVEKCTFCYGRVNNGEDPACVVHCPGKCRIFGDVNDSTSDISKYIKENDAFQIKGTGIYYVMSEGMDRSILPKDNIVVASPEKTEETSKKEKTGGIGTGAIVAGVGAAALGGGYAYMKSRDKNKKNKNDISKGGDK